MPQSSAALELLELQLEDLKASAEDELAGEKAGQRREMSNFRAQAVLAQAVREYLPSERVVIAARKNSPCCGFAKLLKLAKDVTETLGVIRCPRKVRCTRSSRAGGARRSASRRRGLAGANLLAMILFEQVGQHQLLDQITRANAMRAKASQSIDVGRPRRTCTAVLQPLHALDSGKCSGGPRGTRRRHRRADPDRRQPVGGRIHALPFARVAAETIRFTLYLASEEGKHITRVAVPIDASFSRIGGILG
ncbi:hypothetical protein GCM10007880_57630 [Mesorhizobium amorphae]|uniref:hypothetical protein n=1 Tax=Mesorhizobium amorphae TaxID=71433 RepID=UPI00235BA0DC|nr:hypothetical protein [Mesorhizobium amorphae]GLR45246.1 hypothetical protein GCM10007880_57630 [Mesorhizobium amorphae]